MCYLGCMTNHIGYYTVSFSEDGNLTSFELQDDEFYCDDACLDAAWDGLRLQHNWMPIPHDLYTLIGGPATGFGHGLTWAAMQDSIEVPENPRFGIDILCRFCETRIAPVTSEG